MPVYYQTWMRRAYCEYCHKKHRYNERHIIKVGQQLRLGLPPLTLYASLCPDCYRHYVLGQPRKQKKRYEFLQKSRSVPETRPVPSNDSTRLEKRFAAKGWKAEFHCMVKLYGLLCAQCFRKKMDSRPGKHAPWPYGR